MELFFEFGLSQGINQVTLKNFMTKKEFRLIQKKRILEISERRAKEEKICKKLERIILSKKKVICYRADKWEVNIDSVWQSPNLKEIDFYFPSVISMDEKKMEFIKPESWKEGAYGLSEPVGFEKIVPEESDYSIIPSLGFHKLGFRLGRGAGFYDLAFQGVNSKKMIGITFSELFSVDFPYTDYDIRVGSLVTDVEDLFF